MSKSKKERKALVKRDSRLSVVRQCELLEIHRSGVYYEPRGETALNLELMRIIDEKNLLHPWLGVPRILTWLRKDKGYHVNKKRIERLFRLMGLSATGPNPNTSKRGKGELHRIYKYLLRNLDVDRCGQVWATDITYIPVRGGYLYLCAIIDLYSRYVVGWSLSNTMTSEWCRKTLETAIERHGAPEDPEHRPGEPVHLHRVHGLRDKGKGDPPQYGRKGQGTRQHIRRTPLAQRKVRARIPVPGRRRAAMLSGAEGIFRILQRRAEAPEPGGRGPVNNLSTRKEESGMMARKEELGFSTKTGSYESPPGPPSFNTIIKLIFKELLS